MILASGFALFYDPQSCSELFVNLARHPAESVHVMPGLLEGLQDNAESSLSSLVYINCFAHTVGSKPRGPGPTGMLKAPSLSAQELLGFFEFTRSLVLAEPCSGKPTQTTSNIDTFVLVIK